MGRCWLRMLPLALVLLALLLVRSDAQEGSGSMGGHWLFRHFVERMDCLYDRPEAEYWEGVYGLLTAPSQGQAPVERLGALGATLQDILLPFGVADPVVALSCPLGASAALQELAGACVDALGEGCLQRALRLSHLAKLLMLFNFNDYGAWFAHTRWRIDMSRLSNSMQELTHAARADGLGGAVPMAEPLDFRDPSWRIGLVTYCNYNDSVTSLTRWSRGSKQAYADKHGYTLFHFEKPFVTQAHPWMNKLIAIQTILRDFDWVFWVDCDLFFMNPSRTVDAVIRSAVVQNPDASLLIAEDGMMLNSGSFLLRNNAWGADFLARTVDLLSAPMPYSFQHMPWHEQAPLMYLALVPSLLSGLSPNLPADPGVGGALSNGYDPRVVLLQQRAMNSYPPELVQKTGHALAHQAWEDGDLVISFNGCASILGGDFCEDMYGRYHSSSMERFVLGG